MSEKEKEEEKEEIESAQDEQREMTDEYVELEQWRKENDSYHVGAYLFEKFEEEIKEVSENAKNDIVVYDPRQNRVYTIPSNADSVSTELVPLKLIVKEE